MTDRRLIEDSLPLAEISEESAREKYRSSGHIQSIHTWWARRPLAACRAAVYAALVNAPKTPKEREQHHEVIRRIVQWDSLTPEDPNYTWLAEAKSNIAASHAERGTTERPRVLDPFSGGGAIPLEAQRLGCETYANDLNPVAHVLELASLRYPQLFAEERERPSSDELPGIDRPSDPRLARELERAGHWIEDKVTRELSQYYPASRPDMEVLGYLWVRTVKCANPACRAVVPVVNQTWLANKPKKKVAYQISPSLDRRSVVYSIHEDASIRFDPKTGTYGNNKLECPLCGEITSGVYLREEGMNGRISEEPIVVVEVPRSGQGRSYRLFTDTDKDALRSAQAAATHYAKVSGTVSPERPSSNARGLSAVTRYGYDDFGKFFNARQNLALRSIQAATVEYMGRLSDRESSQDFVLAIRLYLALSLNRMAHHTNRFCRWFSQGESIQGIYSKQALAMIWDYMEGVPFGESGSTFGKATERIASAIRHESFPNPASVLLGSATEIPLQNGTLDAIITDPPYYDSVPYADISDFFYVWLRETLGNAFPEAFAPPLTPKRREIIQHNPRHGGEQKARDFYESEMTKAFVRMHDLLNPGGIVVVVFAHKTTAAWETLINSLLAASLVVTASWPVDTEHGSRTAAQGAASLASSVFIVCRKRSAHDDGFLDDVEPALKTRLHERLDYFWSQGIRGADFFMSAIGPAVEVFGRHKRVLKLSGDEVTIAELLDKVRGIVADYALQRIVHGEAAGNVDEASRFYVIWRWAFGGTEVESGEAIHMAQSMGVEFNELVAEKGVLDKQGDKVSLKGPLDRKKVKGLGEPAATGTLAPLIDVLHRAANLWSAGDRQDLADFLATALPPGGADRMQRLAQSIVDVLPPGDKERGLYENFLVGARSLPTPTTKTEAPAKQQKLF